MTSINFYFWGLANREVPAEPDFWPYAQWVEEQGIGE